jgi:hypothetical protein
VHRPTVIRSRSQTFRNEANRTLELFSPRFFLLFILLLATVFPVAAREKDKLSYGEGLIVNLPLPESEVAQVVEDVAQNGVIRGSKEYNKDEYISGAKSAASTPLFAAWTEGGKVFYKVREGAIDPRNFKDGGDVGTLVVRYIVQPQGDKNTVLRINALFKEDFRHSVHQSNGSVESAEYKDIQEHLEAIEVMKQQTAETKSEKEEQLQKKRDLAARKRAAAEAMQSAFPVEPPDAPDAPAAVDAHPESSTSSSSTSSSATSQAAVIQPDLVKPEATAPDQPAPAPLAPAQSLQDRVKDLQKQVQRTVKPPGAPLKSAPFHTASTLESLTAGTEVLILISTPYWYGVETHDGQHGWMQRDDLEQP